MAARQTRRSVARFQPPSPSSRAKHRHPRAWVERQTNLKRFTKMPQGGHFAALEEPELLVADWRSFFGSLR